MKQRDSFLIYFLSILIIFSFTSSTSSVFAHSSLESSTSNSEITTSFVRCHSCPPRMVARQRPRLLRGEVETPFPLSLDLNNNQFVIETLKGNKVLKVFPDQIVKDLLEDHVISVVRDVVKLDDINDSLVFEVNGVKIQKLFGFITVSNPIKVSVSVDSGKIISEDKPLITYLIELISF